MDFLSIFKADTSALDVSFENQVELLRKALYELDDIDLIQRADIWCRKLCTATEAEKCARNILIAFMQNQLRERGTLSNLLFCVDNLTSNLNELIEKFELQNFELPSNPNPNRESTYFKDLPISNKFYQSLPSVNHSIQTSPIDVDKATLENKWLREELRHMEFEVKQREMKIQKLEHLAQKSRSKDAGDTVGNGNGMADETLKIIVNSISTCLNDAQFMKRRKNGRFQLDIFGRTALAWNENNVFLERMEAYDKILEQRLNEFFKSKTEAILLELSKSLCASSNTVLREVRQKHRAHMMLRNWVNTTKLNLIKIKAYSKLRSAFIDIHKGKGVDMRHMLKKIEEDFEAIVNEVLHERKD